MSVPDALQALAVYGGTFVVAISPIVGVELWARYAGRRELDKTIAETIIENNKRPPYSSDPEGDKIVRRALRRNGYDPDNPQLGIYQR